MLLIVWISIPFPNDLLWWEQFIAILSLKSVTCEVCRLAASLQNRTLPEINSLSYMPHVALYELFMDCFHEWHLYLLHGSKQKYADVSAYRRAGLFSDGFLSRDVVGCMSIYVHFYDRFTGSRSSIRLWWSSFWWVSSAWSSCERCEKTMRATVKRTISMKWYAESQCQASSLDAALLSSRSCKSRTRFDIKVNLKSGCCIYCV